MPSRRATSKGARYANGEFIQVHPTSIPGEDKLRLMSESARGEGGRVWVPRTDGDKRSAADIPESERWYFLEEKYPAYGNLVPRDIATREIFQVCLEGHGVGGENQVYLDLTHIPAETLTRKLGAILEIYEMFVGDDPRYVPMRIFPGRSLFDGRPVGRLRAADEYSRVCLRPANAITRSTEPTAWVRTRLFRAFTADLPRLRRRSNTRKNVERGNTETNGIYDAELKRQQEINDQIVTKRRRRKTSTNCTKKWASG